MEHACKRDREDSKGFGLSNWRIGIVINRVGVNCFLQPFPPREGHIWRGNSGRAALDVLNLRCPSDARWRWPRKLELRGEIQRGRR